LFSDWFTLLQRSDRKPLVVPPPWLRYAAQPDYYYFLLFLLFMFIITFYRLRGLQTVIINLAKRNGKSYQTAHSKS